MQGTREAAGDDWVVDGIRLTEAEVRSFGERNDWATADFAVKAVCGRAAGPQAQAGEFVVVATSGTSQGRVVANPAGVKRWGSRVAALMAAIKAQHVLESGGGR